MTKRYSEIIALATQSALTALDGPNILDEHTGSREFWFKMYQAQCRATDEFKTKADEKGDAALMGRIKDLEFALKTMNEKYARLNESVLAASIALGIR